MTTPSRTRYHKKIILQIAQFSRLRLGRNLLRIIIIYTNHSPFRVHYNDVILTTSIRSGSGSRPAVNYFVMFPQVAPWSSYSVLHSRDVANTSKHVGYPRSKVFSELRIIFCLYVRFSPFFRLLPLLISDNCPAVIIFILNANSTKTGEFGGRNFDGDRDNSVKYRPCNRKSFAEKK